MVNYIPDEILRRSSDPLDQDIRVVHVKSNQIYVFDILEMLHDINDIQIIRLNVYTDGKMRIIENTRRVEFRDFNTRIMPMPTTNSPVKGCINQAILELPVELIDFHIVDRFKLVNLFVDSEHLDKLSEKG